MLNFDHPTATKENKATVTVKPGTKQFFHVRAVKGTQKSQPGIVSVSGCESAEQTSKTTSLQQSLANSVNQAFQNLGKSVLQLFAK